jgi:hypothetical protein
MHVVAAAQSRRALTEEDMGLLDNLGQLLQKVNSGQAGEGEVHTAFDQVAKGVPSTSLADGLAHAFKSDQTPPFEQMVGGLFGQSSGEQKAGILNQVLATLGSGGVTQALAGAGGLAGVAGMLGGGSVTPQQAEQVPPEAVQVLAKQAAQKDPSIVDQAASFYAQHPTLVKSIGAGALALLMSKLSASRR